jgi:uncharacterized protein (DUF2164 family)
MYVEKLLGRLFYNLGINDLNKTVDTSFKNTQKKIKSLCLFASTLKQFLAAT